MTATNHALTGSVFALATASVLPWWIILPVAFLLHFVLDALPHFGQRENQEEALRRLAWLLPLDIIPMTAVFVFFVVAQPGHWLIGAMGAFACLSPDLFQIPRYIRFRKTGDFSPAPGWFHQFHHKIQWGERMWGMWIELPWAVVMFVLLLRLT